MDYVTSQEEQKKKRKRKEITELTLAGIYKKYIYTYRNLVIMVPNKLQGFCARLKPFVKSKFYKGYRHRQPKKGSNHAFFRYN